MAEIPKNNTGLSGEYFVAAELYRRGWSVGLTMGNAKSIDLFAEKGDSKIAVQVKSLYKRKHSGWPFSMSTIKNDCFYIFVILNGDKMSAPDYFICTSEEVKQIAKTYKTRGIVTVSSLNSDSFSNKWGKLK